MCRCNRSHSCPNHATDICLYVPFCILFVAFGSVQVVSGIVYYISILANKMLVNIVIGCWVILTGIGTGMVACICTSAPRKHESLLYCTLSVLVLNVLNLIYLKFGLLKQFFGDHAVMAAEFEQLEKPTAELITTWTAVALVIVAFVEAQLNFYLLHRCQRAHSKRRCAERKNRQLYAVGNDQSTDLEYVIPRKPDLHHEKSISPDTNGDNLKAAVQVHQKSWVFEATGDEDDEANYDESSVSLCSSASPTHSGQNGGAGHHNQQQQQQQHHLQLQQTAQPQPQSQPANGHNRQRRHSRVSDAASERFAMQMSSFSRCATPSPVPRSGQQTPTHLFSPHGDYHEATITGAPAAAAASAAKPASASSSSGGNRLTVDFLAAATAKLKPVGSAPHSQSHSHSTGRHDDPASMCTQPDDSPYASLLVELEHSLHDKKAHSSFSPDNTSLSTSDNKFSSKSASSSKDLEFSKELEAALQLIQELETPSEGPYLGDTQLLQHHQNAALVASGGVVAADGSVGQLARSDSEKTLSAAVSLPSPEAGPLVDTSTSPPDAVGLPTSASMHRLVIDVRAATTTPTSPPMSAAAAATVSPHSHTSPTTTTPSAGNQHGKHVFSVFCQESGSQSTSGYSSPSTSSHMTHSARDSCETTDSQRTLNSLRCGSTSIVHIQAPSTTASTTTICGGGGGGGYNRHEFAAAPTPAPPSATQRRPTTTASHSLPGYYHQASATNISPPMTPMTTFISTLTPQTPSLPDSRSSCASSVASATFEYRNPVAMTSSPSSRSTMPTIGVGSGPASGQRTSTSSQPGSSAASKSFLLFKKRSKLMPQADFQSRIFKSECLAYLTEEELVQRHQLTRNVIRNIEMNVARRVKGCQPD